MLVKLFISVIIALLIVSAASATPTEENPIELHKINGYDVYLVHVPNAPKAYLMSHVPTGSHFDEPTKYAGRAHLWEHVIHLGSEKYPTGPIRRAFLDRLGAKTNAGTGSHTVQYHIEVNSSKILPAIDVLGDMLTRPLFNEEAFLKEREVVKNEALSYQQQDIRALLNIIELQLRPENHPLRMYDIGTQEQLSAMTMTDLKKLFYSDYLAENVKIILADDFSKSGTKTQELLAAIEQAFKPIRVPPEYVDVQSGTKKEFPDVKSWRELPKNAPIAVEIESLEGKRYLQLEFDISSTWVHQHSEAVEVLLDYLNVNNRGGLREQFQRQGLVTNGSFSNSNLNNRNLYRYLALLTAEGMAQRNQIVEKIFAALGRIAQGDMDVELVEYLKSRNIEAYKKAISKGAEEAVDILTTQFNRNKTAEAIAQESFNFKARFEKVTKEEVIEAARRIFNPDIVLMAVVAPEFKREAGSKIDPTFNRAIRLVENAKPLEVWRKSYESGQFENKTVDIRFQVVKVPGVFPRPPLEKTKVSVTTFVAPTKVSAREKPQDKLGVIFDKNIDTHAGEINLQLAAQSPAKALALNLVVNSFFKEKSDYMDYLFAVGQEVSINSTQSNLIFKANGHPENSLAVLDWITQEFASYQPTPEILKWAMDVQMSSIQQKQGAFSSQVAIRDSLTILNKKLGDNKKNLMWLVREEKKNPGTIARYARESLSRMDMVSSFVGNWNLNAVQATTQKVRDLWPLPLTASQVQALDNLKVPVQNTTFVERKMPGNREADDFAQVRVWTFGDLDSQKDPKFFAEGLVLGEMLKHNIFNLNRSQKGLGYIHGASFWPKSGLGFFGETRGDNAKTAEIEKGWNDVLKNFQVTTPELESAFADAKLGILSQLTAAQTPEDQTEGLNANLRQGRSLAWRQEVIAAIRNLDLVGIQALAHTYLNPTQPYLDIKLKGTRPANAAPMICENLFKAKVYSSTARARASLK